MNAAICGVPYPPNHADIGIGVAHRCGLFDGHDGDHRDWGVLETPGEATSWIFSWEVAVLGG